MRVVFIVWRLADDGGSRVVMDMANCMVAKGHRVWICIPRGGFSTHFQTHAQIREIGWPFRSRFLFWAINFLLMVLAVPRAEVYLGGLPPMPLVAFLASRLRGAAAFNLVQGDDLTIFDDRIHLKSRLALALYHAVAWLCCRLPLRAIANSQWTAEIFRQNGGGACQVVNPGLNTQVFRPRPGAASQAHSYEIACVGARAPGKGLPTILEALHLLHVRGKSVRLTIIARRDLNLGPTAFPVRVVTPRSDAELSEMYASAHVFVHAAWHEGFGFPPLEAMACGVPVVLTDSGGPREYAVDGFNCLMVRPKDPCALAEAIHRLLEDGCMAAQLVRNGIVTASRFSLDKSCAALQSILTSKEAR